MNIFFGEDAFAQISALTNNYDKFFILTDENIYGIYSSMIASILPGKECVKIVKRGQFSDHVREFHDGKLRHSGIFQKFSFSAGGGTGGKFNMVTALQMSFYGEQSIFLGTADDHPGDDMTDFQSRFVHNIFYL